MAKLKRLFYGLPMMAPYRAFRTAQLASRHRLHPLGFLFAGSETYFDAAWEVAERDTISRSLAHADVFIDVGANQGLYTCLAAAAGVQTAAIEPEAGNLRFLLSNVHANGFRNVEIFPVALAAAAGVETFYGDGDVASLILGWHQVRQSFSQLVPSNSLDNLFADRWADRRLFLKVDVEGAEMDVLRGATRLLARSAPTTWLLETFLLNRDKGRSLNTQFGTLFEMMFDTGYACSRVDTGAEITAADVRQWVARPLEAALGRSNFLFRR